MKIKFLAVFFLVSSLLFLGLGCNDGKENLRVGNQIELDSNIKLFIDKPESWDVKKFNTLYKNSKTPSGYTYVSGGINYGLGPKDEKGDIHIALHVIAIPKSYVEAYEKGKFPVNAERRFDAGEYVVYTAVLDSKNSDVQKVIASIQKK